jgi:FkbM family methyltransferase
MTPEQIADREYVWKRMAEEHPEFTHEHDWSDNYHAIREIVLSGSVTWAAANGYFKPWKGKKVMDVGANAGIFATYCGLHDADVVAYEPFPKVFAAFSQMLERTGLTDRVKAIPAAVWTETGEVPYLGHTTPNEDVRCFNGGVPTSGVKWTPDDFQRAEMVKCISFDEAVGDIIWDCVKMDIEGGEFEVLMAASPEKLQQIKFMYVEFHDWAGEFIYNETIKKLEQIFRCKYYRAEGATGRYECAWLFHKG